MELRVAPPGPGGDIGSGRGADFDPGSGRPPHGVCLPEALGGGEVPVKARSGSVWGLRSPRMQAECGSSPQSKDPECLGLDPSRFLVPKPRHRFLNGASSDYADWH